jgi:hypothetical protein
MQVRVDDHRDRAAGAAAVVANGARVATFTVASR